jgi:hypothetical protein
MQAGNTLLNDRQSWDDYFLEIADAVSKGQHVIAVKAAVL